MTNDIKNIVKLSIRNEAGTKLWNIQLLSFRLFVFGYRKITFYSIFFTLNEINYEDILKPKIWLTAQLTDYLLNFLMPNDPRKKYEPIKSQIFLNLISKNIQQLRLKNKKFDYIFINSIYLKFTKNLTNNFRLIQIDIECYSQ